MVIGVARKRARPKLLLIAAAVLAVALAVTLVARPWASTREVADPAPGDRVLQTVNLSLQKDGSLSKIGDTIVISRAQTQNAETKSATYDPNAVVDDLPVRVLTSYRTDKTSGTNLSDLIGHTGQVTIDLTVENLTVQPQQLIYDVAGQSRTRTAMVGAPLTVVASAALPVTDVAKVVTAANTSDAGSVATNGVVSRAVDNAVQVQWATILAPPQLAATATLRLVVEAKDFTLPAIDLSVQPGLVTDPSVGALVDAAFNPKSSGELELQSRTIALVGDVNSVLVRAGDTVAKVRGTLNSTSKTLGAKTVTSLKTDTANINASLKSSDANIKALGRTLESSLKSTNSGTLARLSQAVGQLDAVLGDPGAQAPAPRVSGAGCQQQVATSGGAGSVYASLAQVTAQLNAYASATQACKVVLQQAIVTTIGPADPKPETCRAQSVTCSLAGVEAKFATIAEQLVKDADEAAKKLDPVTLKPITDGLTAVIKDLQRAVDGTERLLDPNPVTALQPTLEDVGDDLDGASASLSDVDSAVARVNTEAVNGGDDVVAVKNQNSELANRLCDLIADVPQPNTLDAQTVANLRAYLVDGSCRVGDPAPQNPPPDSMFEQLDNVDGDFQDIEDQTRTENPVEGGVVDELSELEDDLDGAAESVQEAVEAVTSSDRALKAKITALRAELRQASVRLAGIRTGAFAVQTTYTTAKTELDAAIGKAGSDANAAASKAVKDEIKRVATSAKTSSDDLDELFTRSAAGLNNAADKIRQDGGRTVRAQRGDLNETLEQAERILDNNAKQALSSVSEDVSSATRDLAATRTLLNRDLTNILLDLGTPGRRGTGVLGLLATGATSAGSADYQIALASDRISAYGAVRGQDLNGILLRQAQAEASLRRQADLPAFARTLPATTEHRTVYLFHLTGGR